MTKTKTPLPLEDIAEGPETGVVEDTVEQTVGPEASEAVNSEIPDVVKPQIDDQQVGPENAMQEKNASNPQEDAISEEMKKVSQAAARQDAEEKSKQEEIARNERNFMRMVEQKVAQEDTERKVAARRLSMQRRAEQSGGEKIVQAEVVDEKSEEKSAQERGEKGKAVAAAIKEGGLEAMKNIINSNSASDMASWRMRSSNDHMQNVYDGSLLHLAVLHGDSAIMEYLFAESN